VHATRLSSSASQCRSANMKMDITPLSSQFPQTGNTAPSTDQFASKKAGTEQDHYSALARLVAEASQDHVHFRAFIYEFARVQLRKELYPRFLEGDWSEIDKQSQWLEAAINRIEADFSEHVPSFQFSSSVALPYQTTTLGEDAIRAQALFLHSSMYGGSALPIVSDGNDRIANALLGSHLRSTFWRNIQLVFAAAIGLAIYAASDAQSILNRLGVNWLDKTPQINTTNEIDKDRNISIGGKALSSQSNETLRSRASDIPVPTEYGAYAVVNGQLTELEQLPIKVPDPRIAISAAISIPSRTHLPTGQFQFVVFRRDLINNAPDRVSVRVVAQVRRAFAFDREGHAKKTDVEQSWVIRNNSYQMRVAPLADKAEMIVIRSDAADFALPAGRYALELKGVGYDFTIDGAVIDAAHCLERTDALNTSIYTECRKP
jgi:hypothetical protein